MKLHIVLCTLALVALTFLSAAPALAANGEAEAPFRYYTVLDGLTQSNVVDIEQDQAGYLWFTTARGLNRYDGKEFDQYTIADGLPNNSLTALHVSDENSVWVGDARGGVTLIHGARVVHSIEQAGAETNPVLDIEAIGDRTFVVIENAGIFEIAIEDGEFLLKHVAGSEVTGITELAVHGVSIWAQSTSGLYEFVLEPQPKLELLDDSVRQIHVNQAGSLLVADESGQVGIWQDGSITQAITIDSEKPIVAVVTDRTGVVWVATGNELFNYDGSGRRSEYVAAEIQKHSGIDDVTSMFVDRENSLWLSTGSRLIRFLGDRFQHFRLRTSFDSETVWAVSEDTEGRYWFATETKLILRHHDESLEIIGEESGIPEGTVRDVVSDGNGTLWVGMTDKGLYQIDVGAMRATHIQESGKASILDVDVASDGSVWYSTIGSGVFHYLPDEASLTRYPAPENTSVYSLDISSDGSVWFGADEVGLVELVGAVVLLAGGPEPLQRFSTWWLQQSPAFVRYWCSGALAFGILVAYAGT